MDRICVVLIASSESYNPPQEDIVEVEPAATDLLMHWGNTVERQTENHDEDVVGNHRHTDRNIKRRVYRQLIAAKLNETKEGICCHLLRNVTMSINNEHRRDMGIPVYVHC